MPQGPTLEAINALIRRGELLRAYDESLRALEVHPDDRRLQYLAVLTLVRAGAADAALDQLERYDLEAGPVTDDPPDLVEDISALRARIVKDRALATAGPDRQRLATTAAEEYEAIFRRLGRPYACINAATLRLLSGDRLRARELAVEAIERARAAIPDSPADAYWLTATEAEAALIMGDVERAHDALERAASLAPDDYVARAITRRQLRLVCTVNGLAPEVLAPLSTPTVLHFCGHRIAAPGDDGRFPARTEVEITTAITEHVTGSEIGFGYGSLASGADILIAEQLLERGVELHVVLPFDRDAFVALSVAPSGDQWIGRFDTCLAQADTVTYASEDPALDDAELFAYCAQMAMGDAVIRAEFLDTDVEQLAIWDGRPPSGIAGTAADVERWTRSGRRTTVITTHGSDAQPASDQQQGERRRTLAAMLFADVAGYSKLRDTELEAFLGCVLRPLVDALDPYADRILHRNSWGDAFFVVFDSVPAAADCALAFQAVMRGIDFGAVGLPSSLGLRIGAHAGPVIEFQDPLRDERNFYGTHVTQAARIEPRTPVGEVYVTHAFAAIAALDAPGRYSCQYVGRRPAAKDFGTFAMYLLKARAPAG